MELSWHHLHRLGGGVVAEELLQDGLELHIVGGAVGVGIKLGVLDEVRLADQLAQLGEVMVACHGNDHIGVLAHVDVEGGTEGVAGTHTGGVDTADGVADHVGLHKGEHAVQQGHVHILAFAGALPVIQGQQDAGDGVPGRHSRRPGKRLLGREGYRDSR